MPRLTAGRLPCVCSPAPTPQRLLTRPGPAPAPNPGGELFERIISKGVFSEAQAANYFRQMVEVRGGAGPVRFSLLVGRLAARSMAGRGLPNHEELLPCCRAALQAVVHCHRHGVIHRDIKLEVRSSPGTARLAPFLHACAAACGPRQRQRSICESVFSVPARTSQNFLLSDDTDAATLKVCDFGLSTFFSPGQIFRERVGRGSSTL